MKSDARTPEEYLGQLPDDRRAMVAEMRELILENLPDGYHETMNWGMISYEIPLDRYPNTYNGQPLSYLALASQKNHVALYLMTVHGDEAKEARLRQAFADAGKRIDMGKSCLRFKRLDDLPLDAIAETVASTTVDDCIDMYEANRP